MGKQPMTEARRRANKKWNDANMNLLYDHIHIFVPKGRRDAIKEHAVSKGMTVNGLICLLLQTELELTDEEWKPKEKTT